MASVAAALLHLGISLWWSGGVGAGKVLPPPGHKPQGGAMFGAYMAGLLCGIAAAWLGLVAVETIAAAKACCEHP